MTARQEKDYEGGSVIQREDSSEVEISHFLSCSKRRARFLVHGQPVNLCPRFSVYVAAIIGTRVFPLVGPLVTH